MNRPPPHGIATAVVQGDAVETLLESADADVALAIWHRPVPAAIAERLAMLDLDTVDDLLCSVEASTAATMIAAHLESAGYPVETAGLLAVDTAACAQPFAALLGEDQVSLRLEVVETDACRKFHADYVTYRLISTYLGPGTQWIARDRPEPIHAIPTGAVSVLAGRLRIAEPPILHRSPPISGSGARRLVLVLDPPITPEAASLSAPRSGR